MSVRVVTEPVPVIDLVDAKRHLRVDHDDDDDLLDGLIAAATAHVDGPAGGHLGRALGRQTLEMRLHDFHVAPGRTCISIPFPPDIVVQSIAYLDPSGAEQEIDSAGWRVIDDRWLIPAANTSWPSVQADCDAVTITYETGYEEVPAPVRTAILMHVAHLYENREAAIVGETIATVPFGYELLLSTYRVYR